ncbi:MAG: phage terminase small subunit P27 family [Rhodospirillaceae bacterium]
MRGRKPTPTALRIINGNPGKREILADEPRPVAASIKCPSVIAKNRVAKREWDRIVPELAKFGFASVFDVQQLVGYCMAVAIAHRAWSTLDPLKDLTYSTTGRQGLVHRTKPEVAILNESLRTIRSIGSEFGLSPAARVRLKGTAQGDFFDDFDQFLNQNRVA